MACAGRLSMGRSTPLPMPYMQGNSAFQFHPLWARATTTEIVTENVYKCLCCDRVYEAKLGERTILDDTPKPEANGTWLDFEMELAGDDEEEVEEAEDEGEADEAEEA